MRPLAVLALALVTSCSQHPKIRDARDLAALDPALVTRLDAPDASDRAQAAFALGELGIAWRPASLAEQVEAEAHLVDRLGKEKDPAVQVEIVAALGRVGRSRGRTALLGVLAQPGPARARAGLALSHLYRRLRDHDLDPLVDLHAIEAQLATPDVDVRRGVVAALAAMNRDQARASLRRAIADADPICRAVAADGLAALSQPDDVPALEHALTDDDERVAAFAARGIARLAERGIAPTLAVAVLHRHSQWVKRPAVLVALANEELLRPELAPFFAGLVKLAPEPGLACLAALAHDRITGKPELIDACPEQRNVLVGRLYAEAAPGHVKDLEPLLTLSRGDDQARALAASAMGRYDDPRVRSRLLELASDSTPRVWAAAADGASAARLREAGPILMQHLPLKLLPEELDYVPSLFAALAALAPKGAADALRPYLDGAPSHIARCAQDALATLLVKSVIHPAPAHPPYDELAIPAHPVVRLETTRGVVRIQLDPIAAPRTVRNFIGLVQKKFYDGITWHRVVPGFVVQGGDPRGDGNGGAGWFIPCEPNTKQYKEGTVGIPLDGLDSGSSQFFVTLLPEPRLEGKFTAFGDVLDGMDTLRQLVPDDKIIQATLEPEASPTP